MGRWKSLQALALSAALALSVPLATAAPVSLTFNGSVTGAIGFDTSVLTDFPIGTLSSFSLNFDDSLLTPTLPVTGYDLGAASGQLNLGAGVWQLDHGYISSYQYQLSGEVNWYQLRFTGTGPNISNNGELFGLFLQVTPDLQLVGPSSILAGFGYPFAGGGGTFYSYAQLVGQFSVIREAPEPASMLLVGLGLVGLTFARRRRFS